MEKIMGILQKNNNIKQIKNKNINKQNRTTIWSLGIYQKNWNRTSEFLYSHLTAALLTIAEIWKQSKCQSLSEWVKKMWPMYKMKY